MLTDGELDGLGGKGFRIAAIRADCAAAFFCAAAIRNLFTRVCCADIILASNEYSLLVVCLLLSCYGMELAQRVEAGHDGYWRWVLVR